MDLIKLIIPLIRKTICIFSMTVADSLIAIKIAIEFDNNTKGQYDLPSI